MADISKRKPLNRRSSSILKRALADIHVNQDVNVDTVVAKKETKRRASKRVSFAETCTVQEFPRNSPNFLKSADTSLADTSGDDVHLDLSHVGDPHHGLGQDARQALDALAAARQAFLLDDGESTVVSGMAQPGGFQESTRCLDRFDNVFDDPHGNPDISAITSVFYDEAGSSDNGVPVAAGRMGFQTAGTGLPAQTGNQDNQTIMFDDQEGGTMDLDLADASRLDALPVSAPKISARDFLMKFKSVGGGRSRWANTEETVLFAEDRDGGQTMDFTQNLPQPGAATTTDTAFNASSLFRPVSPSPEAARAEDRTHFFGDSSVAHNMDLTCNLSPLNRSSVGAVQEKKVSAQSFLALLRSDKPSAVPSFFKSAPSAFASSRESAGQEPAAEEREDMTVTMEMTGCLPSGPCAQPLFPSVSRADVLRPNVPQSLKSLSYPDRPQLKTLAPRPSESHGDDTEMMELTGCVDNTQQLLLEANSSAFTGTAANSFKSPGRSALMDITAICSRSPTPEADKVLSVPSQTRVVDGRDMMAEQFKSGHGAGSVGFRPTALPAVAEPLQDCLTANRQHLAPTLVSEVFQKNTYEVVTSSADQSNREKSVRYNGEETAANMSETCAMPTASLQAKRRASGNRSVYFATEETGADMSMTCAGMSLLREGGSADTSLGVVATTGGLQEKGETQRAEESAANMSLTCALPERFFNNTQHHSDKEKSVAFPEEATAANMSLTCSLPQRPLSNTTPMEDQLCSDKGLSDKEKSVMFSADATAANMSLTCSLPQRPLSNTTPMEDQLCSDKGLSDKEKSVMFSADATAANMSLTCTLPQKPLSNTTPMADQLCSDKGLSDKEKSVMFSADATATNMSLTCALPQKPLGNTTQLYSHKGQRDAHLSDKEKSVMFSADATAANMSLTCTLLQKPLSNTIPMAEQLCSNKGLSDKEKSVMFSADATAANMSLTCILPQQLQNSTTLLHSDKEKSVVFSAEATAANMSLTCHNATLNPADDTNLKQTLCKADMLTKLAPGQTCGQDQDKTVTFKSDQSQSAMELTCASPKNSTAQMTMTCSFPSATVSSLETDCSDNKKVTPAAASSFEKEDKNGFGVGEATKTLMDLTGIFAQLSKKLEEQGEEATEANSPTPTGSHVVGDAAQKLTLSEKPDTGKHQVAFGSSRKLQVQGLSPDMLDDKPSNKAQINPPSHDSLKRPSQSHSFAGDGTPGTKNPRLSIQSTTSTKSLGFPPAGQTIASARKDKFLPDKSRAMEVNGRTDKTSEQVLPPVKVDGDTSDGSRVSSASEMSLVRQMNSTGNSSGGSIGGPSPDILGETMPVFFPPASDTSTIAGAGASMSASVMHTTAESSLCLGKSFVDKEAASGDQAGSFLRICEQLGIRQFELKGRACRRSVGIVGQDVACETVADRLNLTSVLRYECQAKADFFKKMTALLQRDETASEEQERTMVKKMVEMGLVSEAEQSPSVKQLVRGLHKASKVHTQAVWKTHKAQMLNTLTQDIKNHFEAAFTDLSDMTNGAERIATLMEKTNQNISTLESRLDSLRSRVPSRKQGPRHGHKQQLLQQRQSELAPLKEQVSEAKSAAERAQQRLGEVRAEKSRARQRYQASLERRRLMALAHQQLAMLQSLHCWRSLRVAEERVEVLVLSDSVLLAVALRGRPSQQQPVSAITLSRRPTEGLTAWAQLAATLTVDSVSASSQHLVETFSTREQLPQMLDVVTKSVEDIKALCREVKSAALQTSHRVRILGKQVKVEVWCTEKLRKVSLTVDIPVNSYPLTPLVWHAHVVMGDIRECQIQQTITESGGGRNHFTAALQAVSTLINQ